MDFPTESSLLSAIGRLRAIRKRRLEIRKEDAALDMSARAQGMTRSGLVRWLVGRHLKGPEPTPQA